MSPSSRGYRGVKIAVAQLNTNVRSVAPQSVRADLKSMMTEVFDCAFVSPVEGLDAYTFEDGGSLGFYFVADGEALSPKQHRDVGTWIEIGVADVEGTRDTLVAAGLSQLDYQDREHHYFQLPGGQVFRLRDNQ